jgi:hypothetical protein
VEPRHEPVSVGYEFAREGEARAAAADLDRNFDEGELTGLRVYRVRWNDNYIVEAVFPPALPGSRLADARALLGESGRPVHPEDLADYKRAMQGGDRGLPSWLQRFLGSG